MDFSLHATHILTGAGEQRRWVNDGYVHISDQTITGVSHERPESGEIIELGESVLLPGLIDLDALVDIDHLLLDSWHSANDSLLLSGSVQHWHSRREAVLTAEERTTLRTYGLVQLALHGITSFMPIASEVHLKWGESADELRETARFSKELGLRAWLGPSYRSAVVAASVDEEGQATRAVVTDDELGREGFREALEFADDVASANEPLVHPVLLPCRIETMNDELLAATAEEAAQRNLLVRLHSLQQGWERALIQERSSMTPLDLLDHFGLLNDRLLIPHALWTDRHPHLGGHDTTAAKSPDLRRIASAGASVIHCPLTSFRYGEVLHTLNDYLASGVTMSMGSDSFPPDFIRAMDVGVHAANAVFGRGSANLSQYIDAATTGGASALKRPDLGRIESGASADFSAFSIGDFRDGVHDDPLRTLVLNGSARNATFSMVAGRTVMRDGEIEGIDLAALRANAQAVFDKLREGYALRDPQGRPAADIFPPTFPLEESC